MAVLVFISVVILSLAGFYFWRWRSYHLSVAEILHRVASLLPLKDPAFQKFPIPTMTGDYFGFRFAIEGGPKKGIQTKEKGFRFLATVELPRAFEGRIFLQSEGRKTSLKPIAELKLVPTSVEKFDERFLLLADEESLAHAVFQPYLCAKILSLTETNWQLDVHGKEAHFEIWQGILNAPALGELFKVVMECLNALLVKAAI